MANLLLGVNPGENDAGWGDYALENKGCQDFTNENADFS
jgi:hypothetical protein